ncbi:MAG: hypothetical protein EOM68_28860 [Spirochaetia bacterium]|nr:hypothetical protein [Spirochaetia bacterium]
MTNIEHTKRYVTNMSYHDLEHRYKREGGTDPELVLMALEMRLSAAELYEGMDAGHALWWWTMACTIRGKTDQISRYVRRGCQRVLTKMNIEWLRQQPRTKTIPPHIDAILATYSRATRVSDPLRHYGLEVNISQIEYVLKFPETFAGQDDDWSFGMPVVPATPEKL